MSAQIFVADAVGGSGGVHTVGVGTHSINNLEDGALFQGAAVNAGFKAKLLDADPAELGSDPSVIDAKEGPASWSPGGENDVPYSQVLGVEVVEVQDSSSGSVLGALPGSSGQTMGKRAFGVVAAFVLVLLVVRSLL